MIEEAFFSLHKIHIKLLQYRIVQKKKIIHFKSNIMYTDRIQIDRMLFQTMRHFEINSRKYGRKKQKMLFYLNSL